MLIHPARSGDEPGVARVHVRAWQAAYRGLMPDDYLDALRPEDRAQKYRFESAHPEAPSTIVAFVGGVICGFATIAPARDAELSLHGELCALYVDPDWWGSGVGKALVSAARARLLTLGFSIAVAWVLVGNARADRFYRRDGWQPDGMRRTDTVWGVTVDEVRYRRALDGS